MTGNFDLQGNVLWRSAPGLEPRFVPGVLQVRGETAELRPLPGAQPGLPFIVPGFVDLHAHLAIGKGPQSSDVIRENAWKEISVGVLALREPGSPVKVSPGELPYGRPVVVSSGRHIALQKRYNRGLAVELPSDPDQGPPGSRREQLVAEVQRQGLAGDGWVKLVGDWIDRSGGVESDLEPLWSAEELVAAVDAAHAVGAKVSVHSFSPKTVESLLDAGVDSIEHGTGMTRSQMERAKSSRTAVIPTLVQVLKFPEFAGSATRYPRYARTMRSLYERRGQWFEDLLASGVQVLPGSDAGGYQSHGTLIEELRQLVEWGMPPEDVLAAATWRARDFLGLPSLEPGAPADAVVFDSDPLRGPEVWSKPSLVIAAGNRVTPGQPSPPA